MTKAQRTLAEAYRPREVPVIIGWVASRSGSRITIIGGVDGRAGKITVDCIGVERGEIVAWRDTDVVAKLGALSTQADGESDG